MTQSGDNSTECPTAIEGRLDDFADRASLLMDGLLALLQQMTTLTNQMDQLSDRVDRLTAVVTVLSQDAEVDRAEAAADRAAILEMQQEVRQIWQYLDEKQRNQGNKGD